ncbi:MAG: class I SAM-dependent methyltransferase [Microbacteriaceae bacterium]
MAERCDKAIRAASFDSVAEVYEAVRPSYPAQAVDWLVPANAARVADVGAGTGKFTRLLAHSGRHVIAIDPSPRMLEVLSRSLPLVDVHEGTAERIPLADASVDALTFAQAWHWVYKEPASLEAGRVLRPGGALGLIWNLRDERVDWMRELGVAMHADGDQFTDGENDPDVRSPFGEPQRAQFEWSAECTLEGLIDLVRSRSYFAVMSADGQRDTLAAVRTLIQTHPQTAGRDTIALPYVTVCFRYRRP